MIEWCASGVLHSLPTLRAQRTTAGTHELGTFFADLGAAALAVAPTNTAVPHWEYRCTHSRRPRAPRLRPTDGIQTQESTPGIAPKTRAKATDVQAIRVIAAQLEHIEPLGRLHISCGRARSGYMRPAYIRPAYIVQNYIVAGPQTRPYNFGTNSQEQQPKARVPDTHLRGLQPHFGGFHSGGSEFA